MTEFRTLLDTTSNLIIDGDDENDNVTNTGVSYPRINAIALAEGILNLNSNPIGSNSGNTGNNGTNDPLYIPDNTVSLVHTLTLTAGQILTGIDFGNQEIIVDINQPPTLAINAGITLNEQGSTTISNSQLQVTDPDNSAAEVTYTLLALPANGTILLNGTALDANATFTQADIDSNKLSYQHNGSEIITDSFSFTVSDGEGGNLGNTTFNITVTPVNDAPTLNQAIADQNATKNIAFSFALPANTFADVDAGDILTYSATLANNSPLPIWLSFNPITRVFSGTPTNSDVGSLDIKAIATDTAGATATDTFTLTVTNVNTPPNLSNISKTGNEDTIVNFNANNFTGAFNDIDGDTLNKIKIISLPTNGTLKLGSTNVSLNQEIVAANLGDLTFTPNPNFNGSVSFGWNAADNVAYATTDAIVNLTLNPVNDSPTLNQAIAPITVNEDAANTLIDLSNVFSDVDGDTIIKSIVTNTNNSLVTVSLENNNLTLDYLPNQFGTAQITIRGTANGQFVDDTFNLTVNAVDDAPIVSNPISDVSVNEDAANTVIDLTNVFNDIDGDVIVKSILNNTNTSLVTVTLVDNQLTLDYLPNQFGTAQITVRGTANGQFVDDTFTINVGSVDDAPVVSNPITDVTVNENASDTLINLATVFSDIDGDVIVKSILNNTNTGLVTATLVDNQLTLDYLPNQFGTAQITVRATANGQTVDDTFSINVGSVDNPPVVSNPITDVTVNEDASDTVINLATVFSDSDGDVIVKSIVTNSNNALVTTSLENNTLTLDYLPNQFGTAQITVRGTANGQTVEDTFTLTVNGVNDAPTVNKPIDTQILTTNNAFSFTIPSDTFSDVDTGDTLSYTINNDSTFTLTNRTITGTPTQTGTKTLTLVATDSQGLTAQTPIQLNIFNPVAGATTGDNTLTGGDGDDLIDARDGRDNVTGGKGNDRVVGGSGADVLGGGEGRDTFVYTSIRDSGDRLTDFDVNQDYLDFSALLDSLNYTGSNPVTDGYVSWRTLGTGTLISVDSDGSAGRGVARPFITLDGVISSALSINNFVF